MLSHPTRPALPATRSASSDSVPQPDKSRSNGRSKPSKKPTGSMHADVIDRLDFSGVGPMFHHDGPFDACAPSRNRQRQKAPMYAWTAVNPEDEQAYRDQEPASPFTEYYPETPKKKVDAIAEAWGIHEPEPYEDFSAGGGRESEISRPNTYSRRKDARPLDDSALPTRHRGLKQGNIPPPQPVFHPDDPAAEEAYASYSPPSPNGGANLGRNKSLMQRIRKMRDAPNVPVGYDDANGGTTPISPGEGGRASRPTHRAQNSFLGRFGRNGESSLSPTGDAFVYVEDPKMKDLPQPPSAESPTDRDLGYFDGASPGLGRKTSLMRKVRGVVKGGK
ncbi:hypothetical protein OF83DRAFT_1050771 [Amylostereum chailletii]|nr:hypothetical protein OF83DRAFT_1050771 [Amylostereum chailletii]